MKTMGWDAWKARNMKYSTVEEAEKQVLELKRMWKLVAQFPPDKNAEYILTELEHGIEYLQKPQPDFKGAELCLDRANSLLTLEGNFHE